MEPERKIEKWLRAFAKKRRADAGDAFKLHPATRRLLQGEIARKRPKPGADSFSFWKLFRTRWPVPLGFALIVCLGVILFLPASHKPNEQFGKVEAKEKSKPAVAAPTIAAVNNNSPLPATLAAPASQTDHVALLADRLTQPRREELPTSADAGQPALALAENAASQKVTEAAGSVAVVAPPVAAPPVAAEPATPSEAVNRAAAPSPGSVSGAVATAEGFSPAASSRELRAAKSAPVQNATQFKSELTVNAPPPALKNSQRFVQATTKKVPPVLASFELQQNGSQVSVVDRDGSIYKGVLQPVEALVQADSAKASATDKRAFLQAPKKDLSGMGNNQSSAQNYFFRVSGANRSLKQNVVFAGNLIAISNVPANTAQNFGGGAGGGQMQSANSNVAQQQSFSNSRITGTVTIAKTNQMEINAMPVNP